MENSAIQTMHRQRDSGGADGDNLGRLLRDPPRHHMVAPLADDHTLLHHQRTKPSAALRKPWQESDIAWRMNISSIQSRLARKLQA